MAQLPNFLIIGAPKAGSTSLWNELRQHPDIFLTSVKEPNFFCSDSANYQDWSWYKSLFKDGVGKPAIGEASVAYSLVERNPTTPALIAQHLPDIRLIYIVRYPLRRIESAWLHHICKRNPVPTDFSQAVREFRPLIEGTLYSRNLEQYRRYFPDEQILVLFLEDFQTNPQGMLERCDRFLGVNPNTRPSRVLTPRNVSAQKYIESEWLERLRRLPGAELVGKLTPTLLKRLPQKIGTPLPPRPQWDMSTRQWVLEQVGADAQSILDYAGKSSDFWDLDR
ncbi:Sulfotransferase domain superfamily [Synechococcus sp. PCC 7335]|uniref:sulfotransferase domain-containing protein n=1 Tax=Synechococcus sp. (strain ATCC 29403 / PCC 7335) TaxID=91464 RepID=UPI00017EE809|nr:sulfotransferase domain-containing protein [Synechococcus sp. PCC 7335]EDX83992.1 Sulfotransferase domain superfamily [Synechococcus sp. PCC 7335]